MPMMIVFDKVTSYVPGQIVTGHVVIISKSPQKVKGLTMRFIGRSSKLLGEVEGTKRYKKEVYFDEKNDIFGHDGSNTHLRVGETLYPFTFSLPLGLPSSFEWPAGNVLYFVEAKLTRASWKDKRVSSRIPVEGVFDLNLDPMVGNPVEVKRQKYVKHLLSKSGPYGFTFKSNKSGFVLGHSLPFSVEIRNLSKVNSRKLRISLLQEVKSGDGKSVATLVEQMKGPAVTSGEVVTWEARLKIPGGIPPTNLGNVLSYPAVVPVLYFMHVQLSLKNCREDPICIKIPVTIGTISLNRQRALSVPSLDDNSSIYPLSGNGHRRDCPMSQLILPSAALSTSQFSPHLVSATSFTHNNVNRSSSLYPHHTIARSNRTQPPPTVQVLGPVRQYEYYFEYDDGNGSTRHTTSRGDSLFHRRRNQNSYGQSRGPRSLNPYTNSYLHLESPPPSYDEIFTRERIPTVLTNSISLNTNERSHERIVIDSNHVREEIAHQPLSAQVSVSSSSDGSDEDDSSLVLTLSNDVADTTSSNSDCSSGTATPSSCDAEDTGSSVNTPEDCLSCGSSSGSCDELKCHELQNTVDYEDLGIDRPCPCDGSNKNSKDIDGRHSANIDEHYHCDRCDDCRSININVIYDSDDDS